MLQSGPGSDGNKGVLCISQSSRSDCLMSYPGYLLRRLILPLWRNAGGLYFNCHYISFQDMQSFFECLFSVKNHYHINGLHRFWDSFRYFSPNKLWRKIFFLSFPRYFDWGLLVVIIFTNPFAQAGYDTRSIFKRSLTGLNSEYSFS